MTTKNAHVVEMVDSYGDIGYVVTPSHDHRIIFIGYERPTVLRMLNRLEKRGD